MDVTGELPLTDPLSSRAPTEAAPLLRPDGSRHSVIIRARPPPPPAIPRPGTSLAALRAWLIDELFIPAFRPRSSLEPAWQWADRVGLPVEGGGKFLSRKKPHCRTFIAKTTDARIREQHVMKASRAGFTQGVLVRICHKVVHDPGNVQFTAGSKENSKGVNTARLIPALEHLRVIGRPDDDPDDATSSLIRLAGMLVRITGGFTAGAYRTHMVDLCVNDDTEVVQDIPGIGSPADGGRSRIRGREGAQLLSISRPTDWGTPHHRDVATGTLEFFAVPCPHCGTFQELTIDGRSLVDQLRIEEPLRPGAAPLNTPLAHRTARLGRLRFDHCKLLPGIDGAANPGGWDFNRILAETFYECVSGCRIDEHAPLTDTDLANPLCSFSDEVRSLHAAGFRLTHKQAMMLSGRHIASNPHPVPADGGGPRSKRSEHNSDLVSLDFDMTWGHLAKKFAERAHDPAALRNFLNEHAGLPSRSRERGDNVTDSHLAECRAAYERGTLPFVPDIMVIGGDSQLGFRKFVVAAARLDTNLKAWRDIAVIDYGYAALRSDIINLLAKAYPVADLAALTSPSTFTAGRTSKITCGVVDAGGVEGNTPDVYELSYEAGGRILPSFGRSGDFAEQRPTWFGEVRKGWRGIEIAILFYWDEYWKRHIQLGCIKKIREIKKAADARSSSTVDQLAAIDPAALSLPPRLWLPGLPADARRSEFEAEIIAEQLDEKGKWKVLGGTPNDFQDCLKTCFVVLDERLPSVAAEKTRAKEEAGNKKS